MVAGCLHFRMQPAATVQTFFQHLKVRNTQKLEMSSTMGESFTPWTSLAVYHIDQTLVPPTVAANVLALPSQPFENFNTLSSSVL
jgi:hypothetical protein